MTVEQEGGIDFNPDHVDMDIDQALTGGFEMPPVDPALLESLRNAEGFLPTIINVTPPIANLPLFLGLKGAEAQDDDAQKADTGTKFFRTVQLYSRIRLQIP